MSHSTRMQVLEKLRFQRQVELPQRNADYRAADLILALLYATIAGLRRINKDRVAAIQRTFIDLLGLSRFADQSTLRRFLQRLLIKSIRSWSVCTTG